MPAMTKWRVGSDGFMEEVDENGNVITREKRKDITLPDGTVRKAVTAGRGRPRKDDRATHHWILDQNGNKIWAPKGTNPEHIPRTIHPYNKVTHDLICRYVTEGKTLSAISLMEGMPPKATIYTWVRQFPEFKADLKKAKECRAEWFADQAIWAAENADAEEVQVARLKVDTYKWAAEVGDPEQFGKRTKVVGDKDQPVAFLFDTGIRRPEDTLPSAATPGEPGDDANE